MSKSTIILGLFLNSFEQSANWLFTKKKKKKFLVIGSNGEVQSNRTPLVFVYIYITCSSSPAQIQSVSVKSQRELIEEVGGLEVVFECDRSHHGEDCTGK